MEEDAWVADYFTTVGSDGDLELLDPERHSPEALKCVWEDAITDVTIVRTGKGERCPDGYELIDRTPTGHDADLNHGSITSWGLQRAVHLAVRRQQVSKRDDYIAEIQVVYSSTDELPAGEGWELVERSASGKSGNLNKGGDGVLLAVRRAVRNLVECPAAVCSVCVLLRNKEENPPPGYRLIRKDLNRGKFGDVVQLAYQVGGALSTCRLPFRSMILDRYPEQDSAKFPFPGDQLPMFVYPKGMLLEQRSGRDTPKSSFFSFVFTNVDGRRTYTACLTFYEPMLPSAARRLTRKLFTCRPGEGRDVNSVGEDQATQGRMRIGLHGSVSAGGLSSLSQLPKPRSRSGTGTWLGRGDPAGWPRAFARGGMGSGAPAITSTSWTKISAATRATRVTSHSPVAQPSAADIFSSAATTDAPSRKPKYSSPLGAGYAGAGGAGGAGGAAAGDGASNAPPLDGGRWNGEVPFRENARNEGMGAGGQSGIGEASTQILMPTTSPADMATCEEASNPSAHEWGTTDDTLGSELSDDEYDLMCRREDRPCIFTPKTICVISRFPIYGVLRRFLRHLYAISLSWSGVPLERFISMFVSCIPMPPPGGCPFHVYLEPLEDQDPRRSRLKPLSLQMPPDAWLPLMDIDFTAPFRCLSVRSVLTVFALMLQEAKILFLSSRAELLTQVMEALRSLLFPMEWQSVYVPQLPYVLAGYLECPGGFMIGMRLTKAELEKGTGGTAAVVRDLGLDGVANAVNLDAGEVLLCSGHLAETMAMPAWSEQQNAGAHEQPSGAAKKRTASRSLRRQVLGFLPGKQGTGESDDTQIDALNSFVNRDEETATPWLPEHLHGSLASRLNEELFGKAGVRMGVEEDLDQYESAFEFAPAPDRTDTFSSDGYGLKQRMHFSSERITAAVEALGAGGDPSPNRHHGGDSASSSCVEIDTTLVVRDLFLCTMAELLGDICGSVRRSEARRSRSSLRTKPLDELFNMAEFLEGMDDSGRPFLQRLTSTQMFWVMVQKWISTADRQLVFFEECAVAIKNRRAGAVVPCRGKDAPGRSQGDRWNHDNFIPLVEEVRLKRPDLYGLNSHNLYGSVPFEGSRTTPLATPPAERRQNASDVNAWARASAASKSEDMLQDESSLTPALDHPCESKHDEVNTASRARRQGAQYAPVVSDGHGALLSQSTQPLGVHLVTVRNGTALRPRRSEEADVCRICTGPPIIIPGPTVQGLPDERRQPSFRYDNGWPTPLDRDLLHTPPDALPPVVLKLRLHASLRSTQPLDGDGEVSASGEISAEGPCVLKVDSSENSFAQTHDRPTRTEHLLSEDGSHSKPGYTGDKRLWRPHGKGRMVYRDGKVYDGEWRQGRHHGQGSMQHGAGAQYIGQWKLGKQSGFGTMTYPDGSRYEGTWLEDQRHGHGTYVYGSGAVYEGEWENGSTHGKGCYTSVGGSRYQGMYRHGQRCGHGSMAYSGGRSYVGEWAEGVRNGFGTYTLPDGTVFEGFFEQDQRHGEGTLRRDGNTTNQVWEDGKLVVNSTFGSPTTARTWAADG